VLSAAPLSAIDRIVRSALASRNAVGLTANAQLLGLRTTFQPVPGKLRPRVAHRLGR
jgi:hypothetical protein